MAICNLCRSIPLEDSGSGQQQLPVLPTEHWGRRTTWRYIHRFSRRSSSDPDYVAVINGFPFHPSLGALKQSATARAEGEGCELCRLILSSVEKAIQELRSPDPENVHRGEDDLPKAPTWEFWLARRQELGEGFCVFTNTEDEREFCLVAAIGICVREDDPLRSVFAGRPIEEDPTSAKSTAIIKNWVRESDELQTLPTELPPLPARVIDVGNEENGYRMRLVETGGRHGKYISLSHCWGKVTQFTTTKASFAHHQASIDYDQLPKSFRDAVTLTRLLGVRYIWIDSICICQDDGEDWERESAKMTSVYMNSYLTIAASAAKDSTVGCFIPRRPPKYVGLPYTTEQGISGELQAFLLPMRKEALPDLYIDMADNIGEVDHPLSTRAWAVQERVLPRRTLHFGTHQMYFETNEGFRGENGLHVPWRYHSIHSQERSQFGLVLREDQKTLIVLWREMLWNYGPRNLSHSSDKLPAISGIARLVAERLGDEYVAGLWRKSLLQDLLWQGLGVRRVPVYRAPSWSWASVDGIPAMGMDGKWEQLAEIMDVKVELKGKKNIYGEVTSGYITLRAPLVRLLLDPRGVDPDGTGFPYDYNPKIRTEKGDPEGCHSRFDFAFSESTGREEALAMVESLRGVEIFALILIRSLPDDDDDDEGKGKEEGGDGEESTYCALIVRPTEGSDGSSSSSGTMQRVGFVHLSPDVLGECSQLEHPEQRQIVTLV